MPAGGARLSSARGLRCSPSISTTWCIEADRIRPTSSTRAIPIPAASSPIARSLQPSGSSPPPAGPASPSSTVRRRPARRTGRRERSRPGSGSVPPDGYAIYHEFTPQPEDVIITKQRASIFQGTPLSSHLSLLGIQSLIVCGESTSGCVRASAVDGYSSGFHVSLVEECTFDRAELTHKVNLFDLHHKYVDVMHLDEVVANLDAMRMARAAE